MAKPKIDKKKGALMVVIDGKVRNIIMTQKQYQTIIELLYVLNNGIIQVSNQDFTGKLQVTALPTKLPPVVQ